MAAVLKIPLRISLRSIHSSWTASYCSTAGYKPGGENDPDAYRRAMSTKIDSLKKRLNNPRRFQRINDREERGIIPMSVTRSMVAGKVLSFYRGIDMLKGPEDTAILYQMLWHLKQGMTIM